MAADLAMSVDGGPPLLIGCPKDRNAYSTGARTTPFGYDVFKSAYRGLKDGEMIRTAVRGGFQRDDDPEMGRWGRGRVERIVVTPAFVDLLRSYGIAEGTTGQHFALCAEPPPPIELRASTRRIGPRRTASRLLPGGSKRQPPAALIEAMTELNGFVATARIEGTALRGWTRIFNEADHPAFAWDRGGRLYARPHDSYQNAPKAERLALRINGQPVAEIDMRASQLHILYALHGLSLADATLQRGETDPYAIDGLPREAVKAFVTATLGNGRALVRWPPTITTELREQGIEPRECPVGAVAAAVLRVHPMLAGPLEPWARLQFVESEIVVRAMLRLKREHGALALPVHDSLIVSRSMAEAAQRVLIEEIAATTDHAPLPPKLSSY